MPINYSPFQDKIGIGSIVGVPGNSGRPDWGIVSSINRAYRTLTNRYEPYYHIKKISDKTRRPIVCLDVCNSDLCPFCKYGGWTDDLELYTPDAVALLINKHRLSAQLAFPSLLDAKWLLQCWASLRRKKVNLHPVARKLGNTAAEELAYQAEMRLAKRRRRRT